MGHLASVNVRLVSSSSLGRAGTLAGMGVVDLLPVGVGAALPGTRSAPLFSTTAAVAAGGGAWRARCSALSLSVSSRF